MTTQEENVVLVVENKLDIPFKEFTAGQVIQSKQFNDDMKDIEDKVNEVIAKHNSVTQGYMSHISNVENPHKVTAHQTGAYTVEEVDAYIDDLRAGNFNDGAITNRVLHDDCVESRNIKNGSVTVTKVEENFGNQLDISQNIDIINRYTKLETDEIIKSKVGNGTYSKEEINEKLSQIQAGQIVDYTIGVDKLKTDVGELIDITNNPSITNRYTKEEVNTLITENGLPRDWGSISGDDDYVDTFALGSLPVADVMVCGEFKASVSKILDIDIAEVLEARGDYENLSSRLNAIESSIGSDGDSSLAQRVSVVESTTNSIIEMFNSIVGVEVIEVINFSDVSPSLSERLAYAESILNAILQMFSEVVNYE